MYSLSCDVYLAIHGFSFFILIRPGDGQHFIFLLKCSDFIFLPIKNHSHAKTFKNPVFLKE